MLFEPVSAAAALPTPSRDRLKPLRAGILNLWQYEDQIFRFHDGRLILRGENGTGKSKALELLLPFLLDADLRPHRLDPFAGTARKMRWNLLEDGRHDSRVGYVWLELGRLTEDGEPVFVTLGCGLRASQRVDKVDSWYFVSSRRIGADGGISLFTEGRQPLSPKQLGEELGDGGAVFAQAAEYRERVDQVLYGLGGDRFDAMVHLLLQLRRPHLSEKLDPARLSELLSESLPPVDEGLVDQLAQGYERLEHEERALRRLEDAAAAVEDFLGVYRDAARGVTRHAAQRLRSGESHWKKTQREHTETGEEAARVGETLRGQEARLDELVEEIAAARGEMRALEQSEAMRAAEALRAKADRVAELERGAVDARRDAERAEQAARRLESEHDAARQRAEAARARVEEPRRRADRAAREAGLEAAYAGAVEGLDAERGELVSGEAVFGKTASGALRAAVDSRRADVAELRGLEKAAIEAATRHARAEDARRVADAEHDAASERRAAAAERLDGARERLAQDVETWLESLEELRLDDADRDALTRALERLVGDEEEKAALDGLAQDGLAPDGVAPDEAVPLGETVRRRATAQRDALVRERAGVEHELARLDAERVEVEATRERIAAARELGP